jgi:subtilase family serine protease
MSIRRVGVVRIAILAAFLVAAFGAFAALSAARSSASSALARVGSAVRLPAGAANLGALPATQKLQLSIALQPSDPAALQAFATAVSTPGSPDYRHYLTVPEFASRFGASDQQIAALRSSLKASGLSVGDTYANHLAIPVSGTAAQVENAFSTSLARVRLPGGRISYLNTSAPRLAPSVASAVVGVVGLDGTVRDQSAIQRHSTGLRRLGRSTSKADQPNVGPTGALPCQAAKDDAANNGGYTADTISSAYQFTSMYASGDQGAGQNVALFELQPYDPTDIATYQACYGTTVPVNQVNVDGGPGPYQVGTSDDGEAALDIELAIATAPGATVTVYQAPNNGTGAIDMYNKIVSDNTSKVISSSWGSCEANHAAGGGAQIKAENNTFMEAATQGQTIFIASGDSGSAACYQGDHSNTSLSVQDPSAQPFATAVGGTTLFSGSEQNPVFYTPGSSPIESVWNDGTSQSGDASASTGGLSTQWPMPAYQQNAASSVGVINANSITPGISCGSQYCREVPDVSANADAATGYAVYANGQNTANGGGWTIIGGTSAAAPLWAGYTALVNATPTCRGLTVGFMNPFLYSVAGSNYRTNLTDISLASPISGAANNDAIGMNNGLFPDTANYDMATGLGSMIAPALASSLCGQAAPVYTVAVTSPGNQSTVVGTAVSVPVTASDSGGTGLLYTATGLPAGLSINASTGAITGTPTIPGVSTVTVTARDKFANAGSSTPFSWAVVKPVGKPKSSGASFGGLSKGKPSLKFTLSAGLNAPALKSVSVTLPGGLSFAKKAKSLSKGVSVRNGGKLKVKLSRKGATLTITLKRSSRKVSVSIGRPAISESGSLKSKVKRHKVGKLTLKLKAFDTSHKSTSYALKLKAK